MRIEPMIETTIMYLRISISKSEVVLAFEVNNIFRLIIKLSIVYREKELSSLFNLQASPFFKISLILEELEVVPWRILLS